MKKILMIALCLVFSKTVAASTLIGHVNSDGSVTMDISEATAISMSENAVNSDTNYQGYGSVVFDNATIQLISGTYYLVGYNGYDSYYTTITSTGELTEDANGDLYMAQFDGGGGDKVNHWRMCSGFGCQCTFTPLCSCSGGQGNGSCRNLIGTRQRNSIVLSLYYNSNGRVM